MTTYSLYTINVRCYDGPEQELAALFDAIAELTGAQSFPVTAVAVASTDPS